MEPKICVACHWRTDDPVRQKYCEKRHGDPDGKNQHFLVDVESVEGHEVIGMRAERERRERTSLSNDVLWGPRIGRALMHWDIMKTRAMLGDRAVLQRDEEVYDQIDLLIRAHEIVRRVIVFGRIGDSVVKLEMTMSGVVQLLLSTDRGTGRVSVYAKRARWEPGIEVSGVEIGVGPFRQHDFGIDDVTAVVDYLAVRIGKPEEKP